MAPLGAVCVFTCLSANLALQKSFQAIFTLFEQVNTNLQGISIPPHSCLQWRLQPVTSTHIFPPHAIKYHKVCAYSWGQWPTLSLFLNTLMANLSASLPSSWSAWSFLPIPNNFIDVVSPNSWVESKFLHAQRTPKLCPRLLPTFKAWLLSTQSFWTTLLCFNGELYMACFEVIILKNWIKRAF